jgi:sugar (pentulose or hexulose) kinase
MWLEAVDLVLDRLRERTTPFSRIKGISGAGQQHSSVFWSQMGEELLGNLNPKERLVDQLSAKGFAHPWSPNWQDASTQNECDEFDAALGGEEELARITGSKAHHVRTGLLSNVHPMLMANSGSLALRFIAYTANTPKYIKLRVGCLLCHLSLLLFFLGRLPQSTLATSAG